MKQKTIYPIWGVLFVLCAVLGFITQRNTAVNIVLGILSAVFFIPGFLLLADAYSNHDKKARLRIRWISLGSLFATVVLLLANYASARSTSLVLGDVLYYILGVVSAPMFCSGIWALSLFLWACLFIASFPKIVGK